MRKAVIVWLLPAVVSAQMMITAYEKVNREVDPDVLRANIVFEEEGRELSGLKAHFNALSVVMKESEAEQYCHGGGYRLSPRYLYKDGKQEFIGYGGNLAITCEFPDIEHYNVLNKKLDGSMAPLMRKTEGALVWSISSSQRARIEQELRGELLQKARNEAMRFAVETTMECEPQKVQFAPTEAPVMPMMARALESSIPSQSPLRAAEEVSIGASVDYSCVKRVP